MIAVGKYRAMAREAALGLTKGGNDQIGVSFEILDDETGNPTGERITWYGYFTDATTDRTIQALKLCGWDPGPRGEDWPSPDDMHGCGINEVEIEVEHDTYEGKTNAKVKWVNAPGGSGIAMKDKMDDPKKAAFAKRMRAAVLSFEKSNGGNGGAAKPAPKPKAAPSTSAAKPGADAIDDEF
jgi:hypothetical protein